MSLSVTCKMLLLATLSFLLLATTSAEYLITIPQKWVPGGTSQVCLSVTSATNSQASLSLSLFAYDRRNGMSRNIPLIESQDITFELVKMPSCVSIDVPSTSRETGEIQLAGEIDGKRIVETRKITFAKTGQRIYIQSDKYLYKAGQKVHFRILATEGPFLNISYELYSEIYIESPSSSRIAQWLNVTNGGLIHKEFQLIDEPEEGIYQIFVTPSNGESPTNTSFKVIDYVLPRFEVKIIKPKYILVGSDVKTTFDVCANYTFGQPLNGRVSGTFFFSNEYKGNIMPRMFNEPIFGCTSLEFDIPILTTRLDAPSKAHMKVKVEENGTNYVVEEQSSLSFIRNYLKLVDMNATEFKNPDLPFVVSVLASLPDGAPASSEPFSVCFNGDCPTVNSDRNGYVKFAVPPRLIQDDVELKSLNHGSSITISAGKYFSPSNSYLQLLPENSNTIMCNPGSSVRFQLQLLYSTRDMTEANLRIQLVSRGQIQYSNEAPIPFRKTSMPPSINLIREMRELTSNDNRVRGVALLNVAIPPSMSPSVKVLVWYTRPDGEVVPASREFEITKCLPHQVSMSWPEKKVEHGTTLPLTLTAEPASLCSVGIVDKSAELLTPPQKKFSIETLFKTLDNFNPVSADVNQINDQVHCQEMSSTSSYTTASPPSLVRPRTDREMRRERRRRNRERRNRERSRIRMKRVASFLPWDGLGGFGPGFLVRKYKTDYVDALKIFDNAGLIIISDMTYETRPCVEIPRPPPPIYYDYGPPGFQFRHSGLPMRPNSDGLMTLAGPPAPQAYPSSNAAMGISDTPARDLYVPAENEQESPEIPIEDNDPRSHFPETWLWELFEVNDGVHQETLTLPDTITEWVGKAVCVHPDKGVGISAPVSITTFTPFFIDITMVSNIVKGEVMPIVISVFNYLDTPIPVRVSVTPSPEFEIYIDDNPTAARDQSSAGTFTLCVPQGDKNTIDFRLKPLVVGDTEMVVSAFIDETITSCQVSAPLPYKTDTIIKKFNVEFEGFPKEKTLSKYMCADDPNFNEDFESLWTLEAPQNIVPDSARSWITVVGDLLGSTLENLGNLIKMPYGCGEQNMLNFAPNIYILKYLESTNQLDKATKDKLIDFMNVGYQGEQRYKHPDGSYSVFGTSDSSGSTWLTAFVVKSFAQARSYISVDSDDLLKSMNWLKSTQQRDGCFESRGFVLDKKMKGGLSNRNAKSLSAYITAALLEAGEDPSSFMIVRALSCLKEGGIESRDPYELSLLAYVLSLAKDPSAETAIYNLLQRATKSPDGVHWYLENSSGKKSTSSVAIETAGYALIAMLESDVELHIVNAKLIVKWITEQRNSQGGFSSTQDTVIALQAMSLFESYMNAEDQQVNVRFQGTDLNSAIQVTKWNSLLNQRIEVNSLPNKVFASIEGSGCILTQGVVRYNVKDSETSEAFRLAVSTSANSVNCKFRTLRVCASYLLRDGKSNMAVIEVSLVSGYVPNKEDLVKVVNESNRQIKRFEVDGKKVFFYVDHFTRAETCVEFGVQREVDVADPKPGTVKIYDYYEPEFEITEKYDLTDEICFRSNTAPSGLLRSNPYTVRNEPYEIIYYE